MKTKLLRKVRKRYSIEYYPNQNRMILTDKEHTTTLGYGVYNRPYIINLEYMEHEPGRLWTYETAYEELYRILCLWISIDYGKYGIRRQRVLNQKEKLWYK